MPRIPELDGLRAFAILAVFLVHLYPFGYPASNLTALGWSGVDLFFAVSGFLITGILLSMRTAEHPYRTFYWRRVLRIFPPYYLALILIQLLSFFHGEKQTRNEQVAAWFLLSSLGHGFSLPLMWSRMLHPASFHVLPQALFHQNFQEFRYGKGAFWSLSVEELFYLLWAPIVLKGSRKTILTFCLIPLILCPIFRLLNHAWNFPEAFSFPCRFDSLASGGCVALLFAAVRTGVLKQKALDHGLRITLVLASILLLLLIWRCHAFEGIEVRSTASFAVFGFSLFAILCAAIVGCCARWSGTRWTAFLRFHLFLKLGTISYMAYLVQIPMYTAVGILLQKSGVGNSLAIWRGMIALPATIAFAALSWKYYESPILALKDRRFRAPALTVTETPIPIKPGLA
jgi:peptidoglycan/LPS O-acetylase OafA/YrhL